MRSHLHNITFIYLRIHGIAVVCVLLIFQLISSKGGARFSLRLFTPFVQIRSIPADTMASPAPALLLVRSDGKRINTAERKGKVVFINFWATTCVPCMTEMPAINKLYNHFITDTDVLIIAIDADDDFAASVGFMNKHDFSLPVYNSAGVVPGAYFRGVLPTTVVLDKKGRIAYYYEGAHDYGSKEFASEIERLRIE